MSDTAPSTPGSVERLRLKRWFLRGLIISLAACAFIAVIALLVGRFNELTGKVLLTLAILALHSGIALACAAALERRVCTLLARVGLALFAANFAVFLFFTWRTLSFDAGAGRALLTTFALLGYFVIAIPSADCFERRRRTPLALVGLALCVVGLGMLLVCIWADGVEGDLFLKATGVVAVLAVSVAHAALLLRLTVRDAGRMLRHATLLLVATVAGFTIVAIFTETNDEFFYRLFGAAGVLNAAGTLSLVIVARLQHVSKGAHLETAAPELELTCPRCSDRQMLALGDRRCRSCGLRISVAVEEPRCVGCGFLLWRLPERRCPECGRAF